MAFRLATEELLNIMARRFGPVMVTSSVLDGEVKMGFVRFLAVVFALCLLCLNGCRSGRYVPDGQDVRQAAEKKFKPVRIMKPVWESAVDE